MADLDKNKIDASVLSLALRSETNFLVAARTVNHTVAAQRLGIAKSSQSEWIGDHLKRAFLELAAYDLKVVHKSEEGYVEADILALGRLAQHGIRAILPANAIVDDDTMPGALGER